MLIELHILQNHSPSNLNRDDTGSPKEAVFGGHKRARISSQSLKRSLRTSAIYRDAFDPRWRERPLQMSESLAFRTRQFPEIVRAEAKQSDLGELTVEAVVAMARLFGKLGKNAAVEGENEGDEDGSAELVRSSQTMFVMRTEVRAVVQALKDHLEWEKSVSSEIIYKPKNGKNTRMRLLDVAKECLQIDPEADGTSSAQKKPTKSKKLSAPAKGTLQDIERRASSLVNQRTADIALFGRMVTSEAFVDVEASSQFAHAISTHKVDHEFDYYTAVDDLERSSDDTAGGGADMIGDTEFNSACYYKYFNVHVDGLVENLGGEGARDVAAAAVRALVESAARVSPSAKQNSFAAFQLPSVVLVEVRPDNLPVSYANAFADPVNPKNGVIKESAARLVEEAQRLTAKFDLKSADRFLLIADDSLPTGGIEAVPSLNGLLDRVEAAVRGG